MNEWRASPGCLNRTFAGIQRETHLFGGSGSTLIACEQTDRICRTMELDPKYASVIVQRFIELVGSDEEVRVERNGEVIKHSQLDLTGK